MSGYNIQGNLDILYQEGLVIASYKVTYNKITEV